MEHVTALAKIGAEAVTGATAVPEEAAIVWRIEIVAIFLDVLNRQLFVIVIILFIININIQNDNILETIGATKTSNNIYGDSAITLYTWRITLVLLSLY
jgi:hypothetical protein